MKFFILIALLSPVVASRFNETGEFAYKATESCGGYNSTITVAKCDDNDFCLSPVNEPVNGSLVFKFGDEIQEPLFFTYFAMRFRRGRFVEEKEAINGSVFLCNLVKCPLKKDVEYKLPFQIPVTRRYYTHYGEESKDVIRVTAVVDNIVGDLEVCAKRDVIKFK